MEYIILKNIGFIQYRVYIENKETEGKILYKGHKLGVEKNMLSQLIDYRKVGNTNRILVLKYDKVIGNIVNILDKLAWQSGTSDSFDVMIWESWVSLLTALESKFGKFRKVSITAVNI